jgi:ubiquinone/menaquinone biosynthesis C-methylase UbiE
MSFDALAPHYRWMEWILAGEKLQRCRTAFLSQVKESRNVLIVGEGNGRFLLECRRQLPGAHITVVDASAAMLSAARERLKRSGLSGNAVEFVHADALSWQPASHAYDLIVTHFFLDCFPSEPLEKVVNNLARGAAPQAKWLLADFQIPAHGFGRLRAQIIHAMMYAFFRLATRLPARHLASPDEFLRAQKFVLQERKTSDWGLLHSDLWTRL